MKGTRSYRPALVVMAAFVGMLPVRSWAQEYWQADLTPELEMANRIRAQSEAKNFAAMEALAQEIEQRWRSSDPEMYARCTSRLAGRLTTQVFDETKKNLGFAQHLAMRALEVADQIPLDVAYELLGPVQQRLDAAGNRLDDQAWAELRKKQAKLWLHAWQRVARTIDPHWDPDDLPQMNVMPPSGTWILAGVAPDAIEDPELRAQHEAAIALNERKAARHREQYRARQLRERWLNTGERFLIHAYMIAPDASSELEALLMQHVTDAGFRDEILNAVRTKRLPERMTIQVTTQPTSE